MKNQVTKGRGRVGERGWGGGSEATKEGLGWMEVVEAPPFDVSSANVAW